MIKTLNDLKDQLGTEIHDEIVNSAKLGDPELFSDWVAELDYIEMGSQFWVPFHAACKDKGIKAADFDLDAIMTELHVIFHD